MRLLRIWLLVAVLPTVAGCSLLGLSAGTASSYEGPEPPEEEIAILKGWNLFWVLGGTSASIYSIDGKKTGFLNSLTARLSPGYHCIEVTVGMTSIYLVGEARDCPFGAQFEAGHRYNIKNFAKSGAWAIEMETTYQGVVTTQTIKCKPCVPK